MSWVRRLRESPVIGAEKLEGHKKVILEKVKKIDPVKVGESVNAGSRGRI